MKIIKLKLPEFSIVEDDQTHVARVVYNDLAKGSMDVESATGLVIMALVKEIKRLEVSKP